MAHHCYRFGQVENEQRSGSTARSISLALSAVLSGTQVNPALDIVFRNPFQFKSLVLALVKMFSIENLTLRLRLESWCKTCKTHQRWPSREQVRP